MPTQSSRTCTLTPARARSASASANSLPIVARPVDVGLEVDRLAARRGSPRAWPGRSVAVDEDAVAVARDHRRPEQDAHGVQELRILGRVEVLDPVLDLLLAALRVEDHERDQRRDDDGDDDVDHQRLPAEPAAQVLHDPGAHARTLCGRRGWRRAHRRAEASDPRRIGFALVVAVARKGGHEGTGGIVRS